MLKQNPLPIAASTLQYVSCFLEQPTACMRYSAGTSWSLRRISSWCEWLGVVALGYLQLKCFVVISPRFQKSISTMLCIVVSTCGRRHHKQNTALRKLIMRGPSTPPRTLKYVLALRLKVPVEISTCLRCSSTAQQRRDRNPPCTTCHDNTLRPACSCPTRSVQACTSARKTGRHRSEIWRTSLSGSQRPSSSLSTVGKVKAVLMRLCVRCCGQHSCSPFLSFVCGARFGLLLLLALLVISWGRAFQVLRPSCCLNHHDTVYAGYSATSHVALKEEIKRYQDAVELLSSHRDAHPPATPSILGSSANLA